MKVKSESEVAQSCLTLSDPMDCSLPGSSIRGIFQARVLEWGAIAFSVFCLERVQIIKNIFFHMGVIFVCLFLAIPRSLWDLSFLARDQTRVPYTGSMES